MKTLIPRSRLSRRLFFSIVALLIGLLVVLTQGMAWRRQLALGLGDALVRAAGGPPPDPRIAIVAIDDDVLGDAPGYGRLLTSWDRSVYARLLDQLSRAGARVVVFDLLFSGAELRGDAAFARALRAHPATILVVAQSLDGSVIERPTIQLATAATALGHANLLPDNDGVVRRIPLLVSQGTTTYEALALKAVRSYWQILPDAPLVIGGGRARLPGYLDVPVDQRGAVGLTFASPETGYPRYGLRAVVEGQVPIEAFRDRIVFVGVTATAAGDTHFTPVTPAMHGVEIHAHLTAGLLTQAIAWDQADAWAGAMALGLAGLLGLVAPGRRPLLLFGVAVALAAGTWVLAIGTLVLTHGRLDLGGALLALVGGGAGLFVLQADMQRREHTRVLALFAHQTSPEVLRELLRAAEEGTLRLGGERRVVTVLFVDMRGYTSLAACMPPEDVMRLINTYFAIIAQVLKEHGGTLNQYAGDQVMALFNAPLAQPDHARRALRAAVAMCDAITAFNRSPAALLLPARGHFGIGVNTGVALVGNTGAVERYTYSAIGEVTNIAARLCARAPAGTIYIGPDTTLEDLGELREQVRLVGYQSLKGIAEPVAVYTLTPVFALEEPWRSSTESA